MRLIYVDDLHGAFVGARKFDNIWAWLLAFELVGVPFGYRKFRGGFSSEFVGFYMRYGLSEVGDIPQTRQLDPGVDPQGGGEQVRCASEIFRGISWQVGIYFAIAYMAQTTPCTIVCVVGGGGTWFSWTIA